METLLESLFSMPTEALNDWASIAQSEGSQDPCGVVSNTDLKALFIKPCQDAGFGVSFFAPAINVFFRGDINTLTGEKTLVRAYRSESTNRIVLVPIEFATANPVKSFSELLNRVQTKGRVVSEETVPSLS